MSEDSFYEKALNQRHLDIVYALVLKFGCDGKVQMTEKEWDEICASKYKYEGITSGAENGKFVITVDKKPEYSKPKCEHCDHGGN